MKLGKHRKAGEDEHSRVVRGEDGNDGDGPQTKNEH